MRKCIVLCKGCQGIKPDLVAEKIENNDIKIFDSCEPGSDSNIANEDLNYDMVLFGCPALYHLSNYRGIAEIIDLRDIWDVFEKPEEVALATINSSLEFEVPDIEAVETGNKILYYGVNMDIISLLSENSDLTVICNDLDTAKELFPFRTRVIKPEGQLKTDGDVGNFRVTVKGYDFALKKEGIFTFEVGQLILPREITDRDMLGKSGIYTYGNKYLAAVKAITNLGGFSKFKPVDVLYGLCGASKSGYEGCKLCLACPNGSISYSKENEEIYVSPDSCKECGFCSAICPVSAIKYNYLSPNTLIKKVDSVLLPDTGTSNLEEKNPIAFICEESLGELHNLNLSKSSRKDAGKAHAILPVVVPCVNCLNEVVLLYSVLRGRNVFVIPHKNHKHNHKNIKLANKLLEAFDLPPVEVVNFDDLLELPKNAHNRSKNSSAPEKPSLRYETSDIGALEAFKEIIESKNKREQLIKLLKLMDKLYPIKKPEIKSDLFGMVQIKDNCTACMACSYFCPSEAIKNEKGVIYFNHLLCFACGLCENACPEKAISLSRSLDLRQMDRTEIYRDELIKCPSCGKEHIPKSMYEKLKDVGEYSILFCSECRPRIILEQIYEEATKRESSKGPNSPNNTSTTKGKGENRDE